MSKRFFSGESTNAVDLQMADDIARQEKAKELSVRVARREQRWSGLQINRAVRKTGAIGLAGFAAAALLAGHFASENEAKQSTQRDQELGTLVATPPADRGAYLIQLCEDNPDTTISGVAICKDDTIVPTLRTDSYGHLPNYQPSENTVNP